MYQDDAVKLYEKGRVAQQQGKASAAENYYRKSIKADATFPGAHNNLGTLYLEKGLLSKAETAYRNALRLAEDNPAVLNNVGNVLRLKKQYRESLAYFERALAIEPKYIEAICNLGVALSELEQYRKALLVFQDGIRIAQRNFEITLNYANVLSKIDDLETSLDHYRQAVSIDERRPEAWSGLGSVYSKLGDVSNAMEAYRRAIALDASYDEALTNLALLSLESGDREIAETWVEKAIHIAPDQIENYRILSLVHRFEAGDPLIGKLEKIRKKVAHSADDQVQIDFALAKAYEDMAAYDDSFHYLSEGNRLRKQLLGYTFETDEKLFADIKRLTAELSQQDLVSSGGVRRKMIFIVGMPRSGTTLAEQIISNHSAVSAGGELEFAGRILGAMMAEKSLSGVGFDDQDFTLIRESYLTALARAGIQAETLTDKMPLNFRWVGFLLLAFPGARIINLSRDPIAVCWSNYRQYFHGDGTGFAYDMEDLARFYRAYQDLMAHWHDRFPDMIYTLDYEKLTEQPEPEARKLLDFCGLDFENACLDFTGNDRLVKTASALQVKQGIYKGSSQAWKRFEKHLGIFKEQFGREDRVG